MPLRGTTKHENIEWRVKNPPYHAIFKVNAHAAGAAQLSMKMRVLSGEDPPAGGTAHINFKF